jgi:hypothetical protein
MLGFAGSKYCLNPILHIKHRFILLGDGASQGKEGGKKPGATVVHQDSGDSSKPEFIRGHMFGCMGLAAGSPLKLFSAPIIIELHTKISGMIRKFPAGSSPLDVHNIDRCHEAAAAVADEFIHNNDNEGSEGKKGESARIARMAADAGLFSHPESFKSAEAFIYGANEAAHFHEKNLLRGKNLALLKFVPATGAGGRKTALTGEIRNNLYLKCFKSIWKCIGSAPKGIVRP